MQSIAVQSLYYDPRKKVYKRLYLIYVSNTMFYIHRVEKGGQINYDTLEYMSMSYDCNVSTKNCMVPTFPHMDKYTYIHWGQKEGADTKWFIPNIYGV